MRIISLPSLVFNSFFSDNLLTTICCTRVNSVHMTQYILTHDGKKYDENANIIGIHHNIKAFITLGSGINSDTGSSIFSSFIIIFP